MMAKNKGGVEPKGKAKGKAGAKGGGKGDDVEEPTQKVKKNGQVIRIRHILW